MGCEVLESESHVFFSCPAHSVQRRAFFCELRKAGVCWERLTVVERGALLLDPKKKLVPVVGNYLRTVLKVYYEMNNGGGDKVGSVAADEDADDRMDVDDDDD